jgi:antitoxin component YwqK of YwqJK toxin-antitoxin module
MKKTFIKYLCISCFIAGCHTANKPSGSTNNSSSDTSKISNVQQPVDTNAKDGPVVRHYPNGVIKERSYYFAGRRRGECQSFYPNGKLWSDDYFLDGILNGTTTSYFDNGQKHYEGAYVKGKPSGTWKFYDNDGKLVRTLNYDEKGSTNAM